MTKFSKLNYNEDMEARDTITHLESNLPSGDEEPANEKPSWTRRRKIVVATTTIAFFVVGAAIVVGVLMGTSSGKQATSSADSTLQADAPMASAVPVLRPLRSSWILILSLHLFCKNRHQLVPQLRPYQRLSQRQTKRILLWWKIRIDERRIRPSRRSQQSRRPQCFLPLFLPRRIHPSRRSQQSRQLQYFQPRRIRLILKQVPHRKLAHPFHCRPILQRTEQSTACFPLLLLQNPAMKNRTLILQGFGRPVLLGWFSYRPIATT